MSSKTRSRKRGVTDTGEVTAAGGDTDVSVTQKPSLNKRSARSRKPIKIEVEHSAEAGSPEESDSKEAASELKQEKTESPVPEPEAETEQASTDQATKSSPGKKAKSEPVKVVPPENWKTILENIKIMRSSKTAVVDSMGCERTADLTKEPKVQRFHTLVSLMLSSQTKDQVTFAAMERLKARGLTVQSMLDVDETELGEIIKPVGFYKRKSGYIKKTAEVLRSKYDDDIPRSVEDLCALPGVGPKMAYICMNAAWNENVGIGVDTHVHRISNRLKWTGKKGTNTPEKTREALESWMPRELWQDFNILLVGFGQETCLPIGPKCGICLNKDICPASTARSTKGKKNNNT